MGDTSTDPALPIVVSKSMEVILGFTLRESEGGGSKMSKSNTLVIV